MLLFVALVCLCKNKGCAQTAKNNSKIDRREKANIRGGVNLSISKTGRSFFRGQGSIHQFCTFGSVRSKIFVFPLTILVENKMVGLSVRILLTDLTCKLQLPSVKNELFFCRELIRYNTLQYQQFWPGYRVAVVGREKAKEPSPSWT
jgi:hypothetical protein